MQNPEDYAAGYTKKTLNEKTNKYCSGGAARNLHIAKQGGLAAAENKAQLEVLFTLQPLLESLHSQLSESMELNRKLAKLVSTTQSHGKKPKI